MKSPALQYQENLRKRPEMKKEAYPYFFDKYFKNPLADTGFLDTTERISGASLMQFIPGKIYTFQYEPLYKDILDYYDKRPIILACGQWSAKTGNNILTGINLNFLPEKAKVNTLEYYFRAMGNDLIQAYEETEKTNKISIIKKAYQVLQNKEALNNIFNASGQIGYQFAMRNYIISGTHMRQNVIVEYDDWELIPFLQTKDIVGKSIGEIYKEYIQTKTLLSKAKASQKPGSKRKYTNR